MRDKGLGALFLLLMIGLIGIIFSVAFGRLVATASGQMDAFAEGILFYIDDVDYGPMMFNLTFTADQFYFTDDFMIITSMKRQWGELGFSVSPASANLTVTSIDRDLTGGTITFIVDYDSPFQSTTKIYIGREGRPSSVVGAASWSYDSSHES